MPNGTARTTEQPQLTHKHRLRKTRQNKQRVRSFHATRSKLHIASTLGSTSDTNPTN